MKRGLSERQVECLQLVAEGVTSSKVIADRLGLAPSSVDNYLSRAASELGVKGREEAAAAFARNASLDGDASGSVRSSVSRNEHLAHPPVVARSRAVAAFRRLLDLPPIGGGEHRFNRIEILFSILKIAVVSLAALTALVLFGSGLVWLMGR